MSQNLKTLHTDFLEELEIGQGRSMKTVENYDHYLQRYYDQQSIKSVQDITLDTVRAFRRYLHEQLNTSPATTNYHLIALRQLLKYLARRDIDVLSAEKVGLAKLGEREIDVLYPEEIDALLAAPSAARETRREKRGSADDLATLRDTALLQTLFSTGLRVSEAVSLDRDDIRDSGEIPVRGKGNKVRVVFVSDDARKAIAIYVDQREDLDPALFVNHQPTRKASTVAKAMADRSADKSASRRLTPRTIQRLMKKYAAVAGLTKKVTPHSLRHSFATDLLSNGADVRQVQQLLGHASITTTQIYTHLTDTHLQEVHEKFHRRPSD